MLLFKMPTSGEQDSGSQNRSPVARMGSLSSEKRGIDLVASH
jgi:hypothetical protein